MLGHLRFHRRGHSNPSSPIPDQPSSFDHTEQPHGVQDIPSRPESQPPPANIQLTRPPSGRSEVEIGPNRKRSEQSLKEMTTSASARPPLHGADSGFMGGVTLQNYRRAFESTRHDPSGPPGRSSTAPVSTRTKPLPPPINTDLSSSRPSPVPIKAVRHTSSFVAPTDLRSNAGATGKRPAGTRLTTEPTRLGASQAATEIQKGKKGLPFLKNPMSGLLMRRKASQNAPDLRPLPLPQKSAETPYDPRIRGTRVHDFSAPRQRVVPTMKPTVPGAEVWTGWDKYHNASSPQSNDCSDLPLRTQTGKSSSAASEATQAAASDCDPPKPAELSKAPSRTSTQENKRPSLDEKPLPAAPPVPAPSVKDGAESTRSISTRSRAISASFSVKRPYPSTRTNKSHHVSLSEDSVSLSALPKHMKSTSSRFSFDMVGAAMAEKQLEERHRQKELERKANGGPSNRDSRFDDFDEDAFDYDAAMDDDGLEEAIPGVNADYEDEYFEEDIPFEEDVPLVGDDDLIVEVEGEDDPDNDQENFAGFVFSRSNPQSSMVSPATPGMLATPRDASGRPIGHAITTSPLPMEDDISNQEEPEVLPGELGVQDQEDPQKTHYDPTVFQERRGMQIDEAQGSVNGQDKGIYYDAGLLEELQMEADEIQKTQFDESIFDDDDVDSFGRPMPGVFAYNQAMRAQERETQVQEPKKRDSDMTSQSGISTSTAHTSSSVGLQPASSTGDGVDVSKPTSPPATSPDQGTDDKVAAYQRALAEAAHKAASSGWKSRWDDDAEQTSSLADPDVTITSPTTDSHPSTAGLEVEPTSIQDYEEDDGFGNGFDDEFDDDSLDEDFIAEANAEALAYDSDGFYGDEFGFYSAPIASRTGSNSSSGSGNLPLGNESVLGGYFGPSGSLGRTISGRVLREPNLTPITERSEYSNRNSILSMGPLSSGFADFRNSMTSPNYEMMRGLEDSLPITLGDLNRIRGKTFGGSQISLSSSRDGSPRSERAPLHDRFEGASSPALWDLPRPPSNLGAGAPVQPHERKNSIWSNSDAASATGSPITNSIPPQPMFSPPPPPLPQSSPGPQCPPVMEDEAEETSSSRSPSPSPERTARVSPADSPGQSVVGSMNLTAAAVEDEDGQCRPGSVSPAVPSKSTVPTTMEKSSGPAGSAQTTDMDALRADAEVARRAATALL